MNKYKGFGSLIAWHPFVAGRQGVSIPQVAGDWQEDFSTDLLATE